MELNTDSGHVTVIIDVSFTESPEVVTAFVRDEQIPFIVNPGGAQHERCEWYLDEDSQTGTLIEAYHSPAAWEILADKVLGSPVNIRFGELFTINNFTVLGGLTPKLNEKLQAMNPQLTSYVGGAC